MSELKNIFGLDKDFYLFEELQKQNKVIPESESEKTKILFETLLDNASIVTSVESCFLTLDKPESFSENCFLLNRRFI